MRFDSPDHLLAWQAGGVFPRIHDAIAQLVLEEMCGSRMLDLGCSYGLLGTRLLKLMAAVGTRCDCIGVERDPAVIAAANHAGIPIHIEALAVERTTLPRLIELIRAGEITVILARRVLPELFGHDVALGCEFADQVAAAGVEEIFLEGRVATVKAVNPLYGIKEEVALLSRAYREARRVGACSYLVRR